MANVNVQKRGNYFQYKFEIASVEGKRKFITKSGFKTKREAQKEGIVAYNNYMNAGIEYNKVSNTSYSDFLDYWIENYCKINLKYHTIESYSIIINNHIKPNIGFYKISQINTATLQAFINKIYLEKGFSKSYLKNMIKVLKSSFKYATNILKLIDINPSLDVKLPKYDIPEKDPAHIFSEKEIKMILERFKNNHCVYYAFLTAYCTGLRVSEVFALTWEDIDFENKQITVNKNVLKKNQNGATHGRHISGKATTMWFFGTCKTQSSYRTIDIGDTLVQALKAYKLEQENNRNEYGDYYMKHYAKKVINPYNNSEEIKIINAYSEIEVCLSEVNFVFVKNNGIYEGTDSVKYPFKVIHYELGIPCRFHDFRNTHATRLIESGADIKAVSKRLGHSTIKTTYDIYVRVTSKMDKKIVTCFEQYVDVL